MSYDLYFAGRDVTQEDFHAYFEARKGYSGEAGATIYQNDDTGVYFTFDHSSKPIDDSENPEAQVSFNMNYNRPHFFALEAAFELKDFVSHFDYRIIDPQSVDEHAQDYHVANFIKGWNEGNKFAYDSFTKLQPIEVIHHLRPTEELEAIWKWNYDRTQIQEQLGADIFVPKIMFIQLGARTASAAVWGDGIASLIPKVEVILVYRRDFAPRRLFRRQPDMCAIPFDQAESLLSDFQTNDFSCPSFLLNYKIPPETMVSFIKKLDPVTEELSQVSMDQVLNRELSDTTATELDGTGKS